ncbi:DNA gyrase subunit A, partial [mine drainage metagenome]
MVRFAERRVRTTGRATYGVRGLKLKGREDRVVAMTPVSRQFPSLLTVTSTGFGKRSPVEDYRLTGRGASGVIGIKTGGRNGHVVTVLPVTGDDEVLLTTQKGITLRAPVGQVREQSRNTLGVILIRVEPGDEVMAAVRLVAPGEAPSAPATDRPDGPGDGDPPEEDDAPPCRRPKGKVLLLCPKSPVPRSGPGRHFVNGGQLHLPRLRVPGEPRPRRGAAGRGNRAV